MISVLYVFGHDINQLYGIRAFIHASLYSIQYFIRCCAYALLRQLTDVFTTLIKVQNDFTYAGIIKSVESRFIMVLVILGSPRKLDSG